jgi:hypothetical protein
VIGGFWLDAEAGVFGDGSRIAFVEAVTLEKLFALIRPSTQQV